MDAGPNFHTIHVPESLLTNRLYLDVGEDKKMPDLGMTEYGRILGPIFTFIGIAFKTKDEKGEYLYINKKSFVNFLGAQLDPQKQEKLIATTETIQSFFDSAVQRDSASQCTIVDLKNHIMYKALR